MEAFRRRANTLLAVLLCLFTLSEVNYPLLAPQSRLAIFAMLGLMLCYLNYPLNKRVAKSATWRALDLVPLLLVVLTGAYIVVQTEPAFESLWIGGQSLGNRAGLETALDTWVGAIGLLLVIEAARRSLGWALPLLAIVFLVYAAVGPSLPGWLFPHRGYGVERIVAQTFLHSQGVYGTALRVMFTYVFLFVIFGAVLKATGATQFIIDFARRVLGGSPGGPAKVAVLSSGMMGSLSGSAVANTATTGTFTIPLMRSSGFRPEIAAGVEAAASSGGALVPPVMGAGAYMMLEIVTPPVTYLQIIRAALLPALLYYMSLFLIVHFHSRRIGAAPGTAPREAGSSWKFEGVVFLAGFVGLITLLLAGYTVFRAVSLALLLVLVVALLHSRTRIGPRRLLEALTSAGRDSVALVAAAAAVGIIIGVVTLTGIGTKLPTSILALSQGNLLSALVLIMISSIVLGMGLPSAVCYLLMATLVGPVLSQLGVVPLSAHLFIFYFGMMSMVTPPVALAAYTAGSIAGAGIMPTAFAAFRFALVGFTLPYMFVFRPELLMLSPDGRAAAVIPVMGAVVVAILGIVPFAAGIAGYLFGPLSAAQRSLALAAAILLLLPGTGIAIAGIPWTGLVGLALLLVTFLWSWRRREA
jgi:TRAP transporter 4TM/12TM fusion protein